jgi:tetratricopeptide (TPR) repeat protein
VYFVRLRLAYLKFRAKFYRESADDYAEAARLAPEAVEPLLGELGALALMERHERSILVADAILQLDPKSYLGRSRRAWALYQLSRYAEAVDEYATVVRLYPGDIEMRLGLGYALSGSKRPVEAAIEFREVLKRMPTNSRARVALGLP